MHPIKAALLPLLSASLLLACGGKVATTTDPNIDPLPNELPPPPPEPYDASPVDVPTDAGPVNVVLPAPPDDAGPEPTHDAGPEPTDAGLPPYLLAPTMNAPNGIALDAVNVYWTNNGSITDYTDGTVLSMPLGGGPITTLAAAQHEPAMIAVHGGNVYWTNELAGTVTSTPVGGGPIVTLASGRNNPYGIAVDDTSVYWTDFAPGGAVMSVPLGGGAPVTLAPGEDSPWSIAVNATTVYWSNKSVPANGVVRSVPLRGVAGGGAITTLAVGEGSLGAIAIDATSVYWLTRSALMSAPLTGVPAGGAPTTLALAPSGVIGIDGNACIAVDGANVYYTGGDSNDTVTSVPLGGGAPTLLASGQQQPAGIAVGPSGVYWVDMGWYGVDGSGSVMRRAK